MWLMIRAKLLAPFVRDRLLVLTTTLDREILAALRRLAWPSPRSVASENAANSSARSIPASRSTSSTGEA